MLLSVAACEALTKGHRRREAVASASGSLAAERLSASPASDQDAQDYVEGRMTAEEMIARAIAPHTPDDRRPAE